MKHSAPNPYHQMSLREIHDAAMRRARELLDPPPGPRTPEQRAQLARDTGQLVSALAGRIGDASPHVPASPERALEVAPRTGLAAAFGDFHEDRLREVRYTTLTRATDYVLGGQATNWKRDAWVDGTRVYDLAMGSDEGLRRVLEHLEAMPRRK